MEIEVPPKMKAKILYDSGLRTPVALAKKAHVCERTAYNYLAEFEAGGDGRRRKYTQRKRTKSTPKLEKRVIRKVEDRSHINSTRAIAASEGISHTLVQEILNENGFSY